MPKLSATYHKIPKDANHSDYMQQYWHKYWSKVMNIKQHILYNSYNGSMTVKLQNLSPNMSIKHLNIPTNRLKNTNIHQ